MGRARLADDLDGGLWERMNTMFKFYNQAWVLLAIAAGALSGSLIVQAFSHPRIANLRNPDRTFFPNPFGDRHFRSDLNVIAYPITATVPRLETRAASGLGNETSLNALDWMEYATYKIPGGPLISWSDDLAAIEWFNDNVEGSPLIVEASIGPYRGNGSRFSIATGLPAVLGWERHEQATLSAGLQLVCARCRPSIRPIPVEEKIEFLLSLRR
ncbi:MAG: hypothetical protein R2845_07835 [Thermomicrobiales bacterium]